MMATRTLRQRWVTVHRWLGLVAGLLFAVMGLSGSVLVYYQELDQWLNPALALPQDRGAIQPMTRILAAAQAKADGRFVHSVYPAGPDFPVHHVWLTPSAADQSRMWEMLVDPRSARVLGERQAVPVFSPDRATLMNTIYTLHYNLFAGPIGATLVGLIGLVLLASVVSGIVLWWPRGAKWRQALTLKRGARGHRLHVDLHRLAGSYGVVLIALAAFTGVCLVFPDYVARLFPPEARPAAATARAKLPGAGPHPDADRVLAAAREPMPGTAPVLLWLPGAKGADWSVTLREPQGIAFAGGKSDVVIDRASGRITRLDAYAAASRADAFQAWQLPLHNGTAFGGVGRILMCIAGLLPTLLLITGTLIFLRRRRARSGRAARSQSLMLEGMH